MWQRFTSTDLRIIAHYLGLLIAYSGLAMCIPMALGLVFGEWEAVSRYMFCAGIAALIGMGLALLDVSPQSLSSQQALAVTAFAWLIISLMGAVPLFMSGHYQTYLDALFESVSAFTTTGATVVQDLDHMSNADNMWRFTMEFLGGLGLVVVGLSIGGVSRAAGGLYRAEGRSEHVMPNLMMSARMMMRISVLVVLASTVVCTFIMLGKDLSIENSVLHSLWLSITCFDTGGLVPTQINVISYHSIPLEFILMIVMIFGGINFSLQAAMQNGRVKDFFKDIEIRTGAIWWMSLTIILAIILSHSEFMSSVTAILRMGFFTIISAGTTTGIGILSQGQIADAMPGGAMFVIAIAMAMGASAGSTSGGIKFMRLGLVAKAAWVTIRRAVEPASVRLNTSYYHIGRHTLENAEVKDAMTVLLMFIVAYMIGTLGGIACGNNALDSMIESIAMAGNGGITTGIAAPGMPAWLEIIYIVEMWAGRLEFISLFALAAKVGVSIGASVRKTTMRLVSNEKKTAHRINAMHRFRS